MDPHSQSGYRSAVRRLRARILYFLLALILTLSGCQKKPGPRIKVVVTIFPIYDLARRVAGPDADVTLLVPPGVPEVDYLPGPRETGLTTGANVGILVGLGLDEWMLQLLDQVAPKARRLQVGDRVPTLPYRKNAVAAAMSHEGMPAVDPRLEGKPDPHVWLDPSRASLMAKAMAEELARADSAHAAAYRQRGSDLERDLEKLDREVEWRVQNWQSRKFVTFRPAFAYFAAKYHLEIVGTLESIPGVIPPIRYDQQMVRLIRAEGIAGVFKEPQFQARPASIVSVGAGVPVGTLDAIGGEEGRESYESLIRFDTDALEAVLKAPPKPASDGGAPDAGPDR
jgi:zinc transport system substrate-binding protein